MKNAVRAWVTIGMMAVGTAAAATHAAKIEQVACDQATTRPVTRARQAKSPVVAAEPAVELRDDEPAVKTRPVRPAPRNSIDTRQLSRVSQRQA